MSSIKILAFEDQMVPDEYRKAARSLLEEAFGDNSAIEFPPEAHTKLLAVEGDGNVIGHLAAYVRTVDFEHHSEPLGMIGDVATAPSFRRQGIAKTLVSEAHVLFRRLDVRHSVLFAYEPAVYMSSGYRMMANEVHFLDEDGVWKTFVYRGSMFCELSDDKWPAGLINLKGRAV